MSGRIWVVEVNKHCSLGNWWEPVSYLFTRSHARRVRLAMGTMPGQTKAKARVVQYVRQGGAR
jgi:hypothetical protein